MRFLLVALAVMVAGASAASILDATLDAQWNEYKTVHNKQYASNGEDLTRRAIWEKNLKYINSHNLEATFGKHTYTLKMNAFGDLVII